MENHLNIYLKLFILPYAYFDDDTVIWSESEGYL